MRLRKYPFLSRQIIIYNLDDFGMDPTTTSVMNPNMTDVHIASGNDMDLLYYGNPMCPQCMSHNIVKNGTFTRLLETGANVNIQRYTCKDCGFSFEARPPNHGYGNHISEDTKKKSIAGRAKKSLRKTAEFFGLIGNISLSHETIRKNVPGVPAESMESSGYFVYDEQYVHINGIERYRALLKDSKTGNFVEEILDDLKEETLAGFFLRAISRFTVPETIFITIDGYHYESVLETVASRMCIVIKRQRCLFHIEKDLAHKIENAKKEKYLDTDVSFINKYGTGYMKWKVIPEEEEMKQLGLHIA